MHSYFCRRTKCITFSFSGTIEAKESDDSLRDGNLQENSNADYENNLINLRKNQLLFTRLETSLLLLVDSEFKSGIAKSNIFCKIIASFALVRICKKISACSFSIYITSLLESAMYIKQKNMNSSVLTLFMNIWKMVNDLILTLGSLCLIVYRFSIYSFLRDKINFSFCYLFRSRQQTSK